MLHTMLVRKSGLNTEVTHAAPLSMGPVVETYEGSGGT